MNNMRFVLVTVSGAAEVVTLDYDKFLDEAYKLLDCSCIEMVRAEGGYHFVLDESGKIKTPPKKVNTLACRAYPALPNDYLAGDVLIGRIDYSFEGGEFVFLTEQDIEKIQFMLQRKIEVPSEKN